jgi:redox-sensitive bicupin YhaK (pirin superfamily)
MDVVTAHHLVRAAERPTTEIDWLDSRHSFSFGDNYDPDNTHHGVLMVHNDDRVAPRQGFDTHPHRDMEIVTWVLSGSLIHQDSMGHSGVIYPGLAQRMSAGTGIRHSERNDTWHLEPGTGTEPVHFVQMWVLPDNAGIEPGYQQLDIAEQLRPGSLVTVASGMPRYDSAIRIANRSAALHVAQLSAGQSVTLPDLPWGHVFVATGSVDLESIGEAHAGDAVRITGGGGEKLTATTDTEVLIWEMHRTLGG